MDIPSDWLSSQVILGAVLVLLAVVGVVFFFRVGARQAPPAAEGDAAPAHDHAHDGDHAGADVAGPSGPGTYGPIAVAGSTSVFETEPCWVSLLPGRSRASAGGSGTDLTPTDPLESTPDGPGATPART